MSEKIEDAIRANFFRQPEMTQFLLAENLALKSLLHEKGLLSPEEFARHKADADRILEERVAAHVEAWKRDHPDVVEAYEKSRVSP